MPESVSRPAASSAPSEAAETASANVLTSVGGGSTNAGQAARGPSKSEYPPSSHQTSHANLAKLALAALGVVFGDIGTSPLYAMRECFHGEHAIEVSKANVYGVLSLVIWSLTLIVSIKYVAYVLRADNKGEGGILALMALSSSALRNSRIYVLLITLGVFGAALLYGDGVITPAISVLSAIEGLQVATPISQATVLSITVAILVGLFAIQRYGTAGIGAFFGPVMLLWFLTLSVLGIVNLVKSPEALTAINPLYAIDFLRRNGVLGTPVLGAVFLVVTGGEALYADLGHFGRVPIRRAWFTLVFPALVLNYMGQAVLLLHEPEAKANPFFLMAPGWTLYPLVALSTMAAVIASQALISGVFSLSQQGIMLGLLPRMTIRHTSAEERGQIYVPIINWMLMLGTIWLVLAFKSSSNLAAAYGIAVTLTMVITTVLAFFLVRSRWNWSLWQAIALTLLLLVPELAFTSANAMKFTNGGWVPLAIGAGLFVVMTSWKRGREVLGQRFREQMLPLDDFNDLTRVEIPARVVGTAVFMTSQRDGTPPAMLHNFLHNRVLHQHVVLLTITTEDAARLSERDRFTQEELGNGFIRVVARYGFMEQPDVPALLTRAGLVGKGLEGVTFFLGRETMIATKRPGMAHWRVHLFSFLSKILSPPRASSTFRPIA
ncbi:MAG: KUP/HAK/KT family potassium transporter [Polyangiaceae bacterium]